MTTPPVDGPRAPTAVSAEAGSACEPFAAVVAAIDDISTLPAVALRVIEVASDPESGAMDLKAAMEADPALCARVLRCVNSASFGLREKVEDLAKAVAYLGFNQIRDLAITATVSDLFQAPGQINKYDRAGLWRHLVAVAVAARMIATRTKTECFENAFLAGLLHDLGIILFDQHRHGPFVRVMESLDGTQSLVEAETAVVGWDHTQLGEAIAREWKLPGIVIASARWHHEPEGYTGNHSLIVHAVAVANLICTVQDISSVGWNLVGLARRSIESLKLGRNDLCIFADDLEGELAANRHLFDLQTAPE